jgi:hypothetical protein
MMFDRWASRNASYRRIEGAPERLLPDSRQRAPERRLAVRDEVSQNAYSMA